MRYYSDTPEVTAGRSILTVMIFLLIMVSCEKVDEGALHNQDLSADSLRILQSEIPGSLYTSLTFISESEGFSVTNDGMIVKTTDGGSNWAQLASPVSFFLNRIRFIGKQTGYITGGDDTGGYLLKTTDAGHTWEVIDLNTPENVIPEGLFFINSSIGFVSGDKMFRRTADGGKTWTEVINSFSGNINDVGFRNQLTGYAVSDKGLYFRTTDGGKTWESVQSVSTFNLTKIYFAGSKTFAVGGPGVFVDLATGNKAFTAPAGANNFLFIDERRCIGIGQHYEGGYLPYGDVFVTNDAWATWVQKKYGPQMEAMNVSAIAKVKEGRVLMIGYGLINTNVIELRY